MFFGILRGITFTYSDFARRAWPLLPFANDAPDVLLSWETVAAARRAPLLFHMTGRLERAYVWPLASGGAQTSTLFWQWYGKTDGNSQKTGGSPTYELSWREIYGGKSLSHHGVR